MARVRTVDLRVGVRSGGGGRRGDVVDRVWAAA